jgi:tight adherence protein C
MTPVAWGAAFAIFVASASAALSLRVGKPTLRGRVTTYRSDAGEATAGDEGANWVTSRRRASDPVAEARVQQCIHLAVGAASGVLVGGVVLRSAVMTVVLALSGAVVGFTRAPARRARAEEERRVRMRLELVTIDQVLAIHVRTGAGPVQAVTRVVERGDGAVIGELRAVLASIRTGRSEAEAFRHAAGATAEPHAARTYRLFAMAAEHGADLGGALRALSDDLRDVRREELRRRATRRRAAMLVPTIAVLAPIMLLFVIAPIPSLVLGGR